MDPASKEKAQSPVKHTTKGCKFSEIRTKTSSTNQVQLACTFCKELCCPVNTAKYCDISTSFQGKSQARKLVALLGSNSEQPGRVSKVHNQAVKKARSGHY